MEGSNNNSKDFNSTGKPKVRLPYPENEGNRESRPVASATSSSYKEHDREHRRERDHPYKKVRERSQDRHSWNSNNSNANTGGAREKEHVDHRSRNRENFRKEVSRGLFREQQPPSPPQQQPSSFQQQKQPDYSYNTVYMDNNRRAALGVMPNQFSFGPFAAMNNSSRWGMNIPAAASTSAGIAVTPSMYMNAANSEAGINPYAFMGMPGDPNLFSMMGMGNHGRYGMMGKDPNLMVGAREILHLNSCVLYPPEPNAPKPTTREKPLGCKTVFVYGFPDNTTEEILLEIFERCGVILTIRMNEGNFCHIRFAREEYIDHAISFSGYLIKIDNKDDDPNTGKLHVDYAQANDDQYEYECRQMPLQREACHGETLEPGYHDPQSVSPVFHMCHLIYKLLKCKEEFNKTKTKVKQHNQEMLLQFNEITKVYDAASLQKDHFTKAQQKNIELWKKQTAEIKNRLVNKVLRDRIQDEMDVSEDEGENSVEENDCEIIEPNDPVIINNAAAAEIDKLKDENAFLKCLIEAFQNDESSKIREENGSLKGQLEDMQKEFMNMSQKCTKVEAEIKDLKLKKEEKKNEDLGECSHERARDQSSQRNFAGKDTDLDLQRETLAFTSSVTSTSNNLLTVTTGEVCMIVLISIFMNAHPFGASIDYICSYVHEVDSTIGARDVEALMKKFPNVFKEQSTGKGACLKKKWFFCGFESKI